MTRTKIETLYSQLKQKRSEIASYVSTKLYGGDIASLVPQEQARLDDEVEQLTENWEEAQMAQMEGQPPDPTGLLQKLLREYHDIEVAILDIRDQQFKKD